MDGKEATIDQEIERQIAVKRAEQAYEAARKSMGTHAVNECGPACESTALPTRGRAFPFAKVTLENVDTLMRYQSWGPYQRDQGEQVREALTLAAKAILRCVPDGRSRDEAIDLLFLARMRANAGISFGGGF